MAVDHNTAELSLPSSEPKFNILPIKHRPPMIQKNSSFCFSSSEFGSDFSSPIGSEMGSTETDETSEEEEEEERTDYGKNLKGFTGSSRSSLLSSVNKPMIPNFEKMKIKDENAAFRSKQDLITEQIRAAQLILQQTMKQQPPNRNHNIKNYNKSKKKGRAYSRSNENQKTEPNSGTTAGMVSSVPGTGYSSGTGVFMPRSRIDTPPKKTGARVVIPAKVVQALKIHFEKVTTQSKFNSVDYPFQNDLLTYGRNNIPSCSPEQNHHRHQPPPAVSAEVTATVADMSDDDIDLPQEWTY